MILHSIRFRLQLWHGLILLLVLTGFGIMAYRMAWQDALHGVDRELEARAGGLFRPMGPPPMMPPPLGMGAGAPGPPPDRPRWSFDPAEARLRLMRAIEEAAGSTTYFVFFDSAGNALQSTLKEAVPPPDAAALRPRPMQPPSGARTRAGNREYFRALPFGDIMIAGRSLEPEYAAMRTFAFSLALGGAAMLAIGLAGGWWLASRAIRPIDAISATAARIAGGDLSRRIPLAQTESELGQLAVVLNSTFERLEDEFHKQARFTADASHELRTPITVMLSQIQTSLARERSAPEYRETLQACKRAAQRMRRLTESLLELTRLDAGQEPFRHDRVELSQVAEESVELVRARADERGVRLHCDFEPAVCLGDPDRLAQVVTNLVDNAIRHTPEGGEVRVRTAPSANGAELIVSDTGEGIPAEALPHVFERFYRADKARGVANGSGAGLGLSICQAIVHAHGGTIAVKSEPGNGAEFRVMLRVQ